MSERSVNRYRASWLCPVVRAVALPLGLAGLCLGTALRLLGLPLGTLGARGLGGHDAHQRAQWLGAFVVAGARYLCFLSDRFPPLVGAVSAPSDPAGPWHEVRRRLARSHTAMASALGFLLFVYTGLLVQAGALVRPDFGAPVAAAEGVAVEYRAPGALASAPLGTDFMGRSVLEYAVKGVATALWIGIFAALLSSAIGCLLGAVAGWCGGWIDELIVWLYTTLDSIPYLLLVMAFSFAVKNNPDVREAALLRWLDGRLGISVGLVSIILVIGLTSWVGVCRVVRAEFIKQRDLEYVAAAKALGYSTPRIMFRHVLPNAFHLVLISYSLLFVSAIKFEVILSFLGLGMEPGEPSWGNMISQGTYELLREETVWWQVTFAGAALFLLLLCVNLLADALRDALDPRLGR